MSWYWNKSFSSDKQFIHCKLLIFIIFCFCYVFHLTQNWKRYCLILRDHRLWNNQLWNNKQLFWEKDLFNNTIKKPSWHWNLFTECWIVTVVLLSQSILYLGKSSLGNNMLFYWIIILIFIVIMNGEKNF